MVEPLSRIAIKARPYVPRDHSFSPLFPLSPSRRGLPFFAVSCKGLYHKYSISLPDLLNIRFLKSLRLSLYIRLLRKFYLSPAPLFFFIKCRHECKQRKYYHRDLYSCHTFSRSLFFSFSFFLIKKVADVRVEEKSFSLKIATFFFQLNAF